MRLWAAAHAIDDMYQGLVPASVPYFVLDRHYSYVAASGLTLAATLGSSLPQPVIGLLVDKWRMGWMAAAGVSLAGIGAGLSGLAPAYPVVWALLLASGLGVAMFHPAAGTSARACAGMSASAMSIFAAGGSAGFFLAPVLATPALVSLGLGATALFIPPAVLIGLFLLRHHHRALARAAPRSMATVPICRARTSPSRSAIRPPSSVPATPPIRKLASAAPAIPRLAPRWWIQYSSMNVFTPKNTTDLTTSTPVMTRNGAQRLRATGPTADGIPARDRWAARARC